MTKIIAAGRLRKSPFYEVTLADGAQSFLPYNRMLIPRGYGDEEAEYWRLINGVAMWDVAAQRQVQIKGPDAARLVQLLCTRDLSGQKSGQGKYVAICNHAGVLINDPIAQKLDEDLYWLSVSDSDIWTWAACVAGERGLDVEVSEPDASPLAIQGPKAVDVVASLFGDWVRELKYFWFRRTSLDGIPLQVARSGWSKQGGFELYLLDEAKGGHLWNLVKEAGQPFDIGPGNPNPSERTESGLINWDVDADAETNPFEMGMEKFVDLVLPQEVIGLPALQRIKAQGVRRHRLGIVLEGDREAEDQSIQYSVKKDNRVIGKMTHQSWSYRMQAMIGYALVSVEAQPGDMVTVTKGGKDVRCTLRGLPLIP